MPTEVEKLRAELAEERARRIELEDGYRFKLEDLRGSIRGMAKGRLGRNIENALALSRDDPPWIEGISMLLQDSFDIIEKLKIL